MKKKLLLYLSLMIFSQINCLHIGSNPLAGLRKTKPTLTKEQLLQDFNKDFVKLKKRIQTAVGYNRINLIREQGVLKDKYQKQLESIGLNTRQARQALASASGEKVKEIVLPKEIESVPFEERLEGILKVHPESRSEIPKNIRQQVYKHYRSKLENPEIRAHVIRLLNADTHSTIGQIDQKLESQLGLVEGYRPAKFKGEAQLSEITRSIKTLISRDLGIDLSDIALHELPELTQDLKENPTQVPTLLEKRLANSPGKLEVVKENILEKPGTIKRLVSDIDELLSKREQILKPQQTKFKSELESVTEETKAEIVEPSNLKDSELLETFKKQNFGLKRTNRPLPEKIESKSELQKKFEERALKAELAQQAKELSQNELARTNEELASLPTEEEITFEKIEQNKADVESFTEQPRFEEAFIK